MKYLVLLAVLFSAPAFANQPIAIVPCPKTGGIGQWGIDDPREIAVIKKFLTTGNLEAFIADMEAIHPAFGEAARRYEATCFESL